MILEFKLEGGEEAGYVGVCGKITPECVQRPKEANVAGAEGVWEGW